MDQSVPVRLSNPSPLKMRAVKVEPIKIGVAFVVGGFLSLYAMRFRDKIQETFSIPADRMGWIQIGIVLAAGWATVWALRQDWAKDMQPEMIAAAAGFLAPLAADGINQIRGVGSSADAGAGSPGGEDAALDGQWNPARPMFHAADAGAGYGMAGQLEDFRVPGANAFAGQSARAVY